MRRYGIVFVLGSLNLGRQEATDMPGENAAVEKSEKLRYESGLTAITGL
jgi:hypothetical protein